MVGRKNLIRQRVSHVDYKRKSALVLNRKGKAYSVILSDKAIAKGIKEDDIAHIRILLDGKWVITDFEKPYSSENDEYAWADAQLMGEY